MTRSRLGLLGLCAAVFAVMAFNVASAQAANEWLILTSGGVVKTAAELSPTIGGELEGSHGILLTNILGVPVEILCGEGTLIGVKLEAGGTLTNGGKVQFTECSVKLEGEEAPECEPHSAGKPVGTIESKAGKGELGLHEGKIITTITPSVGEEFVNIEMGACPIGANVPIKGKLVIEDCEGKAAQHLVIHLIEEEEVLTTLKALGEPATIDGSALIFLTGEHLNRPWGAMA